MSFLQIAFLLGGVAVVGPLLAHLLARPRFRRVPFAMMRFLQVGQVENQSRRRIQNLLILLLRCAVIVLIVLTFAGPLLVEENKEDPAPPQHFLALDNSLSMAYGDYFERLQETAAAYIDSAEDEARFHVYPLTGGAGWRDMGKAQAKACVERLAVSARPFDCDAYFAALRAADGGKDAGSVSGFLASDFTPGALAALQAQREPVQVDSFKTEVVRSADVSNLAVTAAEVRASGGEGLRLTAQVANYGEKPAESRVAVRSEGRELASQPVSVAPGERESLVLEVPFDKPKDGQLPLEVALAGEDGLAADDAYRLALTFPKTGARRAVVVAKDSREAFLLQTALDTYAQSAFLTGLSVRLVLQYNLDASVFDHADVVLFASLPAFVGDIVEAMGAFCGRGGVVVYFMARDQKPAPFVRLAEDGLVPAIPRETMQGTCRIAAASVSGARGHGWQPDQDVVHALENYRLNQWPVRGYFDCQPVEGAVCVWQLENEAGFVYQAPCANGATLLVNTSADDTMGPLFKSNAAVAFCRYLLGSHHAVRVAASECGDSVRIPLAFEAPSDGTAWVTGPEGKELECPVTKGDGGQPFLVVRGVEKPGWVRTLAKPVQYAGVNAPVGETDMTPPVAGAVEGVFADFVKQERPVATAAIGNESLAREEQHSVWRATAWAAFAALLLEALVANRLKR